MRTSILLRIAFLFSVVLASAPARPPEWFAERMHEIETIDKKPAEERFKLLGQLVCIGRDQNKADFDEDRRQVFLAAQSALLKIPGHSKWFGEEIRKMTDVEVLGAYHHERGWYFTALSFLPSPETVQVLGDQLFDERDPWKGIPTDATWMPSSSLAVVALHNLGLENPPARTSFADYHNDLRTWQLWFEQVRAGTRTFSFKGDKTVYSLSGPVAAARDPGPVVLEERAVNAPLDIDPEASAPSRTPSLIALALALLALLLAATRAFRRRNA